MTHKFAGVTIDYYDDRGATLKAKFPSANQLPEMIKSAKVHDKENLANEDFALVMVDQGHVFRKFACTDPGTTAMSVIYFMEHGDKLPDEAQKLAASNLVEACLEHDIMPPTTLTKAASPLNAGLVSGGLGALAGAIGAGEGNRLKGALMGGAGGAAAGLGARALIKKPGLNWIGEQMARRAAGTAPTGGQLAKGLGLAAAIPGAGLAAGAAGGAAAKHANVVDVTGQEPTPVVKTARPDSDEDYAVILEDGQRMYPIDTWDRVKTAEAYWLDRKKEMEAPIRRQFAVKLAQKSFIMGYPLEHEIVQHGARGYNTPGHLKHSIEMRKVACAPGHAREFLDELFSKHAEINPEVYAECLRQFDIHEGLDSGWDRIVPDPWTSTFGVKTAEVVWEEGGESVTDEALHNLAKNDARRLKDQFTEDFVDQFQKDPVALFESMPTPQKKMIARMAEDTRSNGESFMPPTRSPKDADAGHGKSL